MSLPRHAAAAAALFLLPLLSALPGPARAEAGGWDSHPHGAARLISAVEGTGSGRVVDVGIQLRLSPGWHTYWRTPGDAGIPPTIDWSGSANLAKAEIAWPAPQRLPPLGGLETVGYDDGVVLPVAATLAQPGAALHLHAELDYAACQNVCIPYHASLDLVVPPGLARPGPQADLLAAARAAVPGAPEAAGLALSDAAVAADGTGAVLGLRLTSTGAALHAPDLFVEGAGDGAPGRPHVTLAAGGRSAVLDVPIRGIAAARIAGTGLRLTVIDGTRAAETVVTPPLGTLPELPGGHGRLAIAGLALLGGLVLNLMPCVLPVLSLKLLALVGHAGAERRAARRGLLASAAGVIASFAVLAAALIGLRAGGAAIGWGIQFQLPWFLAVMALATTLFAASLWDWLALALPGRVADAVGSVRGGGRLGDAFLLGAFATLLAASCSAPFVGTAVGFALARGPGDIAAVFLALGLGMAAPFLAAAASPGLVAWLPRPGRWMGWLRRVLGLALLATALWLLGVLGQEAGAAAAVATGAALAVLLGVLAWRHHRPAQRRLGSVLAAALAAVAVLVPSLRGEALPAAAPAETGNWQPLDEAAIPRLVAGGKVVLVDVTAAWCLTCKVNELAVLGRPPVAARLGAGGVVAMRADWTRPDPAVTALLQRFGRYGVPMDVVFGPGAPDGILLSELLTPEAVTVALNRAAPAK